MQDSVLAVPPPADWAAHQKYTVMEDVQQHQSNDVMQAKEDAMLLKKQSINLTASAGVLASASFFAQHEPNHHDDPAHQPDTSDNSQQPMSTTMDGVLGLGAVPRRRRGSVADVHAMDDVQQCKRPRATALGVPISSSDLSENTSMLTRVLRAACTASLPSMPVYSMQRSADLCASSQSLHDTLADDVAAKYVERLVTALQQEQPQGGKCTVLRAVEEIISEYRVLCPPMQATPSFLQPYIMEAELSMPPPSHGSPASPSSHPFANAAAWAPPLAPVPAINPLDSLAGLANQLLDEPRRGSGGSRSRARAAEDDYSPHGHDSEDGDESDDDFALSNRKRAGIKKPRANRAVKEQAALQAASGDSNGSLPPGDWQSQPGVCRPDTKKRGSSRKRLRQIEVLLAMNLLNELDVLHYKSKSGKIMATGTVKGNGIWCHRCSQIVGCTEFERCAGSGLRRPCDNIFTLNGTSLQELLQRADAMMLSGAKAMSSMAAAQAPAVAAAAVEGQQ